MVVFHFHGESGTEIRCTLTSVGQAMEIQEVPFNTMSHGKWKAIENN